MNYLNLRCVMYHLISQVPSAHALFVFPCASFISSLAISVKGWRDCSRFRPRALVVTMSCSVWWSSASARRDNARHCLFLRMSGGIIPLTTGSMKIGCIRTPVEGCCSELHLVDVCGHFNTTHSLGALYLCYTTKMV